MSEETKTVRQGEELNEANLSEFLRQQLNLSRAEIEIRQFPAGSSNLTYLVKIGAEEFVLRRPPFGNQVKTAHDMNREFRVLEKLSKIYEPAPRPLLFCSDESIIGAKFYLMERKRGVILRGTVPDSVRNSPAMQKAVCESFIDNLARLHNLDYKRAGLGDVGKPEGYIGRQTNGWIERYFRAKTDDWREIEETIEWLQANIPAKSNKAALVHNDYKFDNVMLNPTNLTEVVGVLDWEMATIGEPLMDLGTTLGYWMDKSAPEFMLSQPFNPRALMENFSRLELAERYAEKTGADISNLLFYYVFGTFKIAVIVQQIYFRYRRGFTKDDRFANFNHFVAALGKITARAIETNNRGEIVFDG
ncbi:MAG: phosphotransferase family protein [Acidobacteriota bacterium]|nr:phosphotransferase family protein [Acidobacteriota bacterium]